MEISTAICQKTSKAEKRGEEGKKEFFQEHLHQNYKTICRPYKAVAKHPPADLFKQLGNPSSGGTKSFALKILQELYPPY
ncbi:hypothetical protein AVEN_8485-1 [Araneus ventricosus]|uniref:Uncharacterized protein n=1 Tax=Araneus ventricosus TaxID=182803 RepID=A0A4Y2IEW2_ARAVE|nr:hypothetical protein AVEN_8485-1 [Araneus ventricosus]